MWNWLKKMGYFSLEEGDAPPPHFLDAGASLGLCFYVM